MPATVYPNSDSDEHRDRHRDADAKQHCDGHRNGHGHAHCDGDGECHGNLHRDQYARPARRCLRHTVAMWHRLLRQRRLLQHRVHRSVDALQFGGSGRDVCE